MKKGRFWRQQEKVSAVVVNYMLQIFCACINSWGIWPELTLLIILHTDTKGFCRIGYVHTILLSNIRNILFVTLIEIKIYIYLKIHVYYYRLLLSSVLFVLFCNVWRRVACRCSERIYLAREITYRWILLAGLREKIPSKRVYL